MSVVLLINNRRLEVGRHLGIGRRVSGKKVSTTLQMSRTMERGGGMLIKLERGNGGLARSSLGLLTNVTDI